jgi:hypothetical protein
MIKINRFISVWLAIVAVLLIVMNSALPVQANRIENVISTPTGAPAIDPSGQGEPVSAEQQEELKAVIQAYFEIRYSALSNSHPYGFRLDGFGNLVSIEPDGKVFLDAELGFGFAPNLSPAKLIAAYDIATSSLSYTSAGSQDGWVLESTETSEVGGSINSAVTSFRLGDDVSNRQYRGILHFNTANLPDNAVITSVILKIKQQGSVTGTDPFTTHSGLLVAIQKPYFGTAASLATGDFQAAVHFLTSI